VNDLPHIPTLLKQAFPHAKFKAEAKADNPSLKGVQCLIGGLWLITGTWHTFGEQEPKLTQGRMVRDWRGDNSGKFLEDRTLTPKTASQMAGWISMVHFKILEEACRYLLDATHPDNFMPPDDQTANRTAFAIEAIRQMGVPDEASERCVRTLPWTRHEDKNGDTIHLVRIFKNPKRSSFKKENIGACLVKQHMDGGFEAGFKIGNRRKNKYDLNEHTTWDEALKAAELIYARNAIGYIAEESKAGRLRDNLRDITDVDAVD
jgi:hypothetical protein